MSTTEPHRNVRVWARAGGDPSGKLEAPGEIPLQGFFILQSAYCQVNLRLGFSSVSSADVVPHFVIRRLSFIHNTSLLPFLQLETETAVSSSNYNWYNALCHLRSCNTDELI